ncbi:hypothetical protein FRAAL0830 [Frankia alni ACN14a]|uniref:Uncharacterized protein n=1 Tax=Frankia alni (strain DSM 45986 / CECT 9034 / ACN14a) TaxID=326424 RepID=Q0RSG4_FRAAA|nr:hypothetical protein FRAAL0830 [Frankia alni ACN14a]
MLVWHPSEATALATAAAMGARGRVEIRDNGTPIDLTDRSAGIDYLTFRRLAEALNVSPGKLDQLRAELHQGQPADERFPLWPVQPRIC